MTQEFNNYRLLADYFKQDQMNKEKGKHESQSPVFGREMRIEAQERSQSTVLDNKFLQVQQKRGIRTHYRVRLSDEKYGSRDGQLRKSHEKSQKSGKAVSSNKIASSSEVYTLFESLVNKYKPDEKQDAVMKQNQV